MQSTTASHPDPASLPMAVRAYKRLYSLLIGIALLLLCSLGAYIYLSKQESDNAYHPLPKNMKLSSLLATDSSGQFIVTTAYHPTDSTDVILASRDGGKHFEEWGRSAPGSAIENGIVQLYVAPDGKSVIALGQNTIYCKPAKADSFTVVQHLFDPNEGDLLKGAAFSNTSDSIFVFSGRKILSFNYQRFDSIAIGSLPNIGELRSLMTGGKSNRLAGIGVSMGKTVAFANYRVENSVVQPLDYFRQLHPAETPTQPAQSLPTADSNPPAAKK